jgi:hypothetical protein
MADEKRGRELPFLSMEKEPRNYRVVNEDPEAKEAAQPSMAVSRVAATAVVVRLITGTRRTSSVAVIMATV